MFVISNSLFLKIEEHVWIIPCENQIMPHSHLSLSIRRGHKTLYVEVLLKAGIKSLYLCTWCLLESI